MNNSWFDYLWRLASSRRLPHLVCLLRSQKLQYLLMADVSIWKLSLFFLTVICKTAISDNSVSDWLYLPAVLMIFRNLFSWIWDQRSHCTLRLEAHSFKSFLNWWRLRAENAVNSVCGLRREGLLPAMPALQIRWRFGGTHVGSPTLFPLLYSDVGTLQAHGVCSDLPGPWLQQ